MRIVVFVVALAACTPSPIGLAGVANLAPTISFGPRETSSTTIALFASLDLRFSWPGDDCPTLLPSFAATIGGAKVVVHDPGGFDDDDRRCFSIDLGDVPVPAAPDTTFVIEDETLRLEGDAGDVAATVDAELVGATDWSFTQGQTFTVTWTPASDFPVSSPKVAFEPIGLLVNTVTRDGDMIRITVPNDSSIDWSKITGIQILVGDVFGEGQRVSQTIACGGSIQCTLHTLSGHVFTHSVAVH